MKRRIFAAALAAALILLTACGGGSDASGSSGSSSSESSSSSDSSLSSSKYSFYVELDSTQGLMLGQHITIEPDLGQSSSEPSEGIMLGEWYICGADTDSPYVWKEVGGRLRMQPVVLGSYNETSCEYQILEGVTLEDFIAFPDDTLTEGMKTTTEYQEPSVDAPEEGGDLPETDGLLSEDGSGDMDMEPSDGATAEMEVAG